MIRMNWLGWYVWGLGVRLAVARERTYIVFEIGMWDFVLRLGPKPTWEER